MRAIQASPDPIVLTRLPDHVVVEASDAFLALVGRTREATLGRPASDLGLWPILGGPYGDALEGPREVAFHRADREPLTLRVSSVAFDHESERYVLMALPSPHEIGPRESYLCLSLED
jgi:PAS domain-containing protein